MSKSRLWVLLPDSDAKCLLHELCSRGRERHRLSMTGGVALAGVLPGAVDEDTFVGAL